MWEHLGHKDSLFNVPWPKYEESALVKDTVEIVVQINGKVKSKLNAPNGMDKAALEKYVMADESIAKLTEGMNIVKVIAVPGKLINLVVK